MGFPNSVSKAAPADTDNPSAGAAQIRNLKLFLEDLLGIQDAVSYSAAPFAIGTAGQLTVSQPRMLVQSGNATTPGMAFSGATGTGLAYDTTRSAIAVLQAGTQIAYLEPQTHVNVRTYGAVGNGVTDDTSAIQAAITAAIYGNASVLFPPGRYRITSPLFLYLPGLYISTSLVGEFSSIHGGDGHGVEIDHSSILDKPALIIQGARSVTISGIKFLGPNNFTTTERFDDADFVKVGVRNSRYSPQCAIAVDPFTAVLPADGGYSGLTAYYNANSMYSSHVVIRDCVFKNQVVCLALSPTGYPANNENGIVENVHLENSAVGIVFGQLQSKGWVLRSLHADMVNTVIDTWTYGARNGSAGFAWQGGDVSRTTRLLRTLSQNGASNSITQGFSVSDVYAENIHAIGYIGDTTTYTSHLGSFTDCTFTFSHIATKSKDAQLVNFAPLTFKGCFFFAVTENDNMTPQTLKFYHGTKADSVQTLTFENCRFQCKGGGPLFNHDGLQYVRMHDCTQFGSDTFRNTFSQKYVADSFYDALTVHTVVWPGSEILAMSGAVPDYLVNLNVRPGMNSASLGSLAVTVTGAAATFTATNPNILRVNDAIYQANHTIIGLDGTTFTAALWPLGVITNISGATVTVGCVSESAASGTLTLSMKWYPMLHYASVVDTTDTSTTVTITDSPVAPGRWYAGNRIVSANIPSGAYIVSGTYPTFVISSAATKTDSATRAYDADAVVVTTTVW